MRIAYRVFAYVVAVEVAVQAAVIVLAVAGLGYWVQAGHVFDKSVMEDNGGPLPFPEVIGFILHGLNGGTVVPIIAVLFLVVSLFAKVPGGIKWAAVVFVLVAVQATLGYAAHDLPGLGALHGLNALALFAAALYAGNRARRPRVSDTAAADRPTRSAAA